MVPLLAEIFREGARRMLALSLLIEVSAHSGTTATTLSGDSSIDRRIAVPGRLRAAVAS